MPFVDEKVLMQIRSKRSAVALLHLQLAKEQATLNLEVAQAINDAGGDPTTDEIDETSGELRTRQPQP